MNKNLKILIIVLSVVFGVALFGVGGYFLVSSLSKTTVSDLRIMTVSDTEIKDTSVYLVESKQNSFDIKVKYSSNNSNSTVRFVSSNPSVANVTRTSAGYRVNYFAPGKTTITAYSSSTTDVYDHFVLTVYQNYVEDIVVDGSEDNTISLFGDGHPYNFSYTATGALENPDCNNMLLRVVQDYDTNIITSAQIDAETKTLQIVGKQQMTDYDNQTIVLESYFVDEFGAEHIMGKHFLNVDIIGYRVSDMQLLVSQDARISEPKFVVLNTTYNAATAGDALIKDGETVLADGLYFTENVKSLYFKVRTVYTNNTFIDITLFNELTVDNITNDELTIGRGQSYYWIEAKDVCFDFADNQTEKDVRWTFNFSDTNVTADGQDVSFTFNIVCMKESSTSSVYQNFLQKLYQQKTENDKTYYEYVYWDTRFRRTDAITDQEGRIIGFQNN